MIVNKLPFFSMNPKDILLKLVSNIMIVSCENAENTALQTRRNGYHVAPLAIAQTLATSQVQRWSTTILFKI